MALTVTSITPASENNVGLVEVEIVGLDFVVDSAASAELALGGTLIPALNFTVVSNTLIRCDFDIRGATVGLYNVNVYGIIAAGLANGFEVTLSNNYCTYTDVKRFCQIPRDNQNNNEKIKSLIPKASEMIELETKRVFNVRSFTEVLDNNSPQIVEDTIFPKYFPVQTVTSLSINGFVKILNSDYWVYNTFIKYNGDIVSENKKVILSYTGGYVVLPAMINQLCTELTSILANLKTVTYTTAEGVDKAVILTTFPDYIAQTYKKYKRVEIW